MSEVDALREDHLRYLNCKFENTGECPVPSKGWVHHTCHKDVGMHCKWCEYFDPNRCVECAIDNHYDNN